MIIASTSRRRHVVGAFRWRNPGIQVRQEYVVAQSETVIRQQLITGAAPGVITFQDEPLLGYARGGFVDPTARLAANGCIAPSASYQAAWGSFVVAAWLYGLAVSAGTFLIYCNESCVQRTEALRKRPIPRPADDWTLDELRSLARPT